MKNRNIVSIVFILVVFALLAGCSSKPHELERGGLNAGDLMQGLLDKTMVTLGGVTSKESAEEALPVLEEINKEFPTRMKGVVEKCNFCAERLAVGEMPACVEASNGAIAFGDLMDPHSDVRELLRTNYTIRRKQNLGTEPAVYYIV